MRSLILALLIASANGSSAFAEDPQLVISSYVSTISEDRSRLFLVIENRTGSSVGDLRLLSFETPGFEKVGNCWLGSGDQRVPACQPESFDSPAEAMPWPPLQPGEIRTFRADLERRDSGKHLLVGLLSWRKESDQSAAQGIEHRQQVIVGPVEVERQWSDFRMGSVDDMVGLFELLSKLLWPVLGFVLGLLINRGAENRAAQQQTWSQMLAKSHENAEKYYLPVSRALREVRREVSDRQEHLFYVAQLECYLRRLVDDLGGLYFKDRRGERMASAIWSFFRDRSVAAFAEEGREDLIAMTDPADTYPTWKARRRGEGSDVAVGPYLARQAQAARVDELEKGFKTWCEHPSFAAVDQPLLHAFELIFDFEINRPYEKWYGRPERLDWHAVLEQETKLTSWIELGGNGQGDPDRQTVCELRNQLRTYRRANSRWWERGDEDLAPGTGA